MVKRFLVQLTADHSLLVPSECARVEREGGLVEHDRLGGFLEVARALGDYDPAAGGKPAGLSSEPEITARMPLMSYPADSSAARAK